MEYLLPAVLIAIALPFALPFPRLYVVLTAITLPFSASLAAQVGGSWVAACDVLAISSILSMHVSNDILKINTRIGKVLRPIRPVAWLAVPYFFIAVFNAVVTNPNTNELLDIFQRVLIVGVWLVFGSAVFKQGHLSSFLKAFVATNVAMSLAWMATPGAAGVLGVQKNPSGGFIAAAFIVVLLSKLPNSKRIPLLLILTAGLVSTGSRGSMLGLAIAIVFLAVFLRQLKRMLVPGFFAAAAAGAALLILPEEVTQRILSQDNEGLYNIDIRQIFINDALYQWQAKPWEGVGVGSYEQVNPLLQRIATHDPHNVYVLSLVEGGYPLLAAFLVMMAGTLIWLLKRRQDDVVILAIGVQLSTLAHAYVDVYWVRGTPGIGWLLIGAAAASAYGKIRDSRASRPKATRPVKLSPAYARLAARSRL